MVSDVERRLQAAMAAPGLMDWRVIWQPDPAASKRGVILPQYRLIMILDVEVSEALEALLHEALKLKLRRVTSPLHRLINLLIGLVEETVYRKKEGLIEDLARMLLPLVGEDGEDVLSPNAGNRPPPQPSN